MGELRTQVGLSIRDSRTGMRVCVGADDRGPCSFLPEWGLCHVCCEFGRQFEHPSGWPKHWGCGAGWWKGGDGE
eukprot:11616068-Alexandrium_andersonii.AAC.1